MNNTYRPISNVDKTFLLVEITGGAYKRLKFILLKSATEPLVNKQKILVEFKLDEAECTNDLGIEELYVELTKALFIGAGSDVSFEHINLPEVNRAYKDFFSLLEGR